MLFTWVTSGRVSWSPVVFVSSRLHSWLVPSVLATVQKAKKYFFTHCLTFKRYVHMFIMGF